MPLTSPGNDDDTGENHQPTLRKNTAEPVEQTLKQNTLIVGNGVAASSILVAALRRNSPEPPRRPSPACRMTRLIASYTDE